MHPHFPMTVPICTYYPTVITNSALSLSGVPDRMIHYITSLLVSDFASTPPGLGNSRRQLFVHLANLKALWWTITCIFDNPWDLYNTKVEVLSYVAGTKTRTRLPSMCVTNAESITSRFRGDLVMSSIYEVKLWQIAYSLLKPSAPSCILSGGTMWLKEYSFRRQNILILTAS